MSEKKVEVRFTTSESGFVAGLKRAETAIKTFGTRATGVFNRAAPMINGLSDRYFTRMNAFLGGTAIALAGKAVIDFDANLARMAIVADLSKKQMMELKTELFAVAKATHQSPTGLLEAVNAIVERTGNFKFAVESLKSMGIVASATGASIADIGATASNLQEKMGITGDEVMTVFDILSKQGKLGSFTLQNMAALFERLLSAASRLDVKGVEGMRRFGAFLQIARRGTGSAEEAATAVEGAFRSIVQNATMLEAAGIKIIDPKKSKAAGMEVFRDFDAILKEIIVRSKGSTITLTKIFDQRAIRAITPLVQSWKKFGDFREFDDFVSMGGDGATIMKDFAFWSEQSAVKIGDLRTQLSLFANTNLAKPIEQLTRALTVMNEHPAITSGALWTLIGLTGALGAVKLARGIGGLFGAGGVAGAALLGKAGLIGATGYAGYKAGEYANEGMGWLSGKATGGKYGGEGWLGSMIYDATHKNENKINLTVNIDKNGNVSSNSDDLNTSIDVDRGDFLRP